jgi:hypothetical protein
MQYRIRGAQQTERVSKNKTIEPKATRFPTPEQYRRYAHKKHTSTTEHHWENEDDDDDDDDTNLDASVVHSIASEIRQGKERRQLLQQQQSRDKDSSGYPFPPVSSHEMFREELLLQPQQRPGPLTSALHHPSQPKHPLPKVVLPSRSVPKTGRSEPSVRSKHSLRMALRSAYQKRKKEKLKEIL